MPLYDVVRKSVTVHRVEAKSERDALNKVDDMDELHLRQCENREHFDHGTTETEAEEVEDDEDSDEE